jgi:hypothetical protein
MEYRGFQRSRFHGASENPHSVKGEPRVMVKEHLQGDGFLYRQTVGFIQGEDTEGRAPQDRFFFAAPGFRPSYTYKNRHTVFTQ